MALSNDPRSFTKIMLDESEMPTQWYNIVPDLPSPPPPPLNPGTHQPIGPEDLAPLFPMDLILQEVSTESYIDIPGEIFGYLPDLASVTTFQGSTTRTVLGYAARLYYKYEGVSPAGSHKRIPRYRRRITTKKLVSKN